MLKFIKKNYIFFLIALLLVSAVWLAIVVQPGETKGTTDNYRVIDFDGSYMDGSGTKEYKTGDEIDSTNEKLVFSGTFTNISREDTTITINTKDSFVTVKVDGKEVCNNYNDSTTPGYAVLYIDHEDFNADSIFEFEIINPYSSNLLLNPYEYLFSNILCGDKAALTNKFLDEDRVPFFINLFITLFGICSLILSFTIFNKSRPILFSFSLAMIFGGVFLLLGDVIYLPLFIRSQELCMVLDQVQIHICILAYLIFLKTNLKQKYSQILLGISISVISVLTAIIMILEVYDVTDLILCRPLLFIPLQISLVGVIICAVFELKSKKSKMEMESKLALLSLSPIIIGIALETINSYLSILPDRLFMEIFIFVSIATQIVMYIIFIRRYYNETIEVEKMHAELLESRMNIMISQIQPHFLYNALTSIAMLCEKNPKRAKVMTIEFANYLRANMKSLTQKNPVPFSEERKHLETYVNLEKMRFGEDLIVDFDADFEDFLLPPLSVQPIVENAIKHGVMQKEDGGTVKISTRNCDDHIEIIVEDDGVGFDIEKVYDDGRQHVGMENVKKRLATMVGGKIEINSEIGKGTKSVISIPKEN